MSTEAYCTLIPLFEELRGERVLVRPYRESDAQALFEAVAESRDHLRPWLPFADAHQSTCCPHGSDCGFADRVDVTQVFVRH